MKRRLILALVLITLIFILSGVFILHNLNVITYNNTIKERQDEILGRYNNILIVLKGAQAELYRHQAGYTRDINLLVDSVLQIEEMLSLSGEDYPDYLGATSCNRCHLVTGKVDNLDKVLKDTHLHFLKYKEMISRIVTLSDFELSRSLEAAATKEGDDIIAALESIRHALSKMHDSMELFQMESVDRARLSIVAAIVVSVVLSVVIIVIIMRSITVPVLKLVKGIENVASGEYGAKVDIAAMDEIGFLSKTFNSMTDNLERVTRQKESLMQELLELNNDLEHRIEEAKEELRMTHEHMLHSETLSVVGTFASGVAHELATPLSSIISYFRGVRDKLTALEQPVEDIEIIEAELLRCRSILHGMLNFARAPQKDRTMTDVNASISEILTLVRYQTEYKKKIVITESPDPDLPGIMAVPGQIKQIFMNIIVNALQSMPGGGELNVATSVAADGKNIIVRISDTGCGIPENEINKIFSPFYTSKESGTGLGLSISYGMIKSHGGSIGVKSEPGKGTTFTISLPVA